MLEPDKKQSFIKSYKEINYLKKHSYFHAKSLVPDPFFQY
jgi:hypothetical protein